MSVIFTVDVEDWFHILGVRSTPGMSEWHALPSRVEQNFRKLLDMFGEARIPVTCFFLGWIAERYPHLVREADRCGHEIASHGYSHRLVYEMGEKEFLEDAARSKDILEDICGRTVIGYRSPGFSVTKDTPWFHDRLMEAGYLYDSSVFPAARGHGGMRSDTYGPYVVKSGSRSLIEFPVTVRKVLGVPLCFFGGGYLRLFPYSLIRRMSQKVLQEGRPVIFYLHPREIDPSHPRLPMSALRKFKSYVNLRTTEAKVQRILGEFRPMTFAQYIENGGNAKGAAARPW